VRREEHESQDGPRQQPEISIGASRFGDHQDITRGDPPLPDDVAASPTRITPDGLPTSPSPRRSGPGGCRAA